jgi:4-hydroxythreonine-4-phosphate dehydrogenase
MHTTIAITMGDINGIGPEVIAKAFAHGRPVANAVPIVLGCARAYQDARSVVPGAARPVVVPDVRDAAEITDGLPFLQGEVAAPRRAPGQLDPEAGRAAMAWLARAVDLALEGAVGGIVTCPIHKEGIHRAGYACRGHTDFIANRTGARSYRMALYVRGVLVVHLTDHVPLRAALESVRADRIVETIHIAEAALRGLGGRHRIAVAGLNPHAGEASAFGSEERDEIAPAVERSRAEGLDCSGPHSPDAVFRQALEGRYDAVVAMYHDQGHIPMKLVAMDEGVNVTLGIPIVRTSVDHGTAYDIAGTGTAREQSFLEAYRLAARMATRTSKVGS